MENLKERITAEMKAAMRAKEKQRLGVIRLIMAEMKKREVDERIELEDTDITAIMTKMVKQRRESISQYEKGNRQDLVDQEQAEIDVIQEFLPEAMSAAEIDSAITDAITQTGAESIKDMGKVMGILRDKLAGRADMGQVSAQIKERLGA